MGYILVILFLITLIGTIGTCEEGGAHLRIFFWHLLMNSENPKNQTFEKMKNFAGDIIILHMRTKNHNHMRYSSWDTPWDIGCNCYFSFWVILSSITLLTAKKNKISQKWKKKKTRVSSFDTTLPKIMIVRFYVRKIWRLTDVIVSFPSGLFF